MKKYKVNVNGFAYEVEIEEIGATTSAPSQVQVASPTPQPVVAAAQPAAAPVQQASAAQPVLSGECIAAPMQGKIIDVKVGVGESVVPGQVIAVLEAMKMENEIVASSEGSVTSVGVTPGQSVDAGDLIVALG